jgi:deoxycytidine triphosphate deaminase
MLGREAIRAALASSDESRRLVITPLLEADQVGAASVDVRLGHQFIILRNSPLSHMDPGNRDELSTTLRRSQEKVSNFTV